MIFQGRLHLFGQFAVKHLLLDSQLQDARETQNVCVDGMVDWLPSKEAAASNRLAAVVVAPKVAPQIRNVCDTLTFLPTMRLSAAEDRWLKWPNTSRRQMNYLAAIFFGTKLRCCHASHTANRLSWSRKSSYLITSWLSSSFFTHWRISLLCDRKLSRIYRQSSIHMLALTERNFLIRVTTLEKLHKNDKVLWTS